MLVRMDPRHADRVLHRISAAIGEEDLRHIWPSEFNDALSSFTTLVIRMLRSDRRQLPGLLLDRGNHLRVLVADIHVHQLRGEVQPLVAVVVPHVRTLGRRDTHRVQSTLGAPRMEDVLTVQIEDVLALGGIGGKRHANSSLYQVVNEA